MVGMFLKQKIASLHTHTLHAVLFVFGALLIALTTSIVQPPSVVHAVGNCPGSEIQGNGTAPLTDTNKCYSNGQATSNTPTGVTDPQSGSGSQDTNQSDSTEEDKGTTCAVENIGWILCPIIKGAATMSDKLFQFLANHFLEVEPELLTSNPGPNGGTITAWEQARNLANIAFVIAFIIIIYSQITGAGLNNYGIKRMLPRLIVAAIAVNISYYICQAMVDVSNLLGYNIMAGLQNIANEIGPSVMGGSNQGTDTETGGGWLAKIAIGALAVAGLVWLLLGPLASIIALILVTCMVVVIILLLRKAFIVLLVVVSPIAFVAYLLPNTEKYFSKWLNMFWQLLMVFPVVALLLGGGQLASTIILVSGSQPAPQDGQEVVCGDAAVNNNTDSADANANPNPNPDEQVAADDTSRISRESYGVQGECGEEITVPGPNGTTEKKQAGWTLGLVAAGVAVAPLLAVWAVLKGALSAAGAIGGKISGAVQRGGGGLGNQLAKGVGAGRSAAGKRIGENASAAWQRSQARGLANEDGSGRRLDRMAGSYAKKKALRSKRLSLSKASLDYEQEHYGNSNLGSLTQGLAPAATARAERAAAAHTSKIEAEEVHAASIEAATKENDTLQSTIASGDVNDPKVAAAIDELAKRQDFEGIEKAVAKIVATPGGTSLASRTLASSLSKNGSGLLSSGQVDELSRGGLSSGSYKAAATKNLENGILSAEKMAESGPNLLNEASRMATTKEAKQSLINSAHAASNDPILSKKISRNAGHINNFKQGKDAEGTQW